MSHLHRNPYLGLRVYRNQPKTFTSSHISDFGEEGGQKWTMRYQMARLLSSLQVRAPPPP